MKTTTTLLLALFTFQFGISQHCFAPAGMETDPPRPELRTGAACDTITSFPCPDSWPAGLAWDGTHFWANGYTDGVIYKLDANGTQVSTIPSPAMDGLAGGSIDFDGTHLIVVVEEDGALYKVDPANGDIIDSVVLPPGDENNLGVAVGGGFIWQTHHQPVNHLYKIDANTLEVVETLQLSAGVICLEYIAGKLYGVVSFFSPEPYLYEIDQQTGEFIDSLDWCLEYASDITWDGTHMWAQTTSPSPQERIYQIGIDINTVGQQEVQGPEMKMVIFPNPTSSVLNIRIEGRQADVLQLIDMNGTVCRQLAPGTTQVDLSELANGMYLLVARFGQESMTKKVLIGQ